MGGVVNSAKGFLGLGSGPTSQVQSGNAPMDILNQQSEGATRGYSGLNDYALGNKSADQVMGQDLGNANWNIGRNNDLATGATTGSRFATDQVMNNPMLSGLFGSGGQLNKAEGKLDDLNNQGFELKPEDMTLYGQTSGNIARMFGAQGNQMSQDLASRGLAAAPSGAAGAMFSGLAGNQNEMLANAQQAIMQQRFQNTQNQIAQQQNFVSQLGQQGANAINQQYGRQLSGAQNQHQNLSNTAGLQNQANAGANSANLGAANFAQENKPQNIFDLQQQGWNTALGAQSKAAGEKAGADGKGQMGAMGATMFGA